jgi:hypothetical protein
MFIGKKRAREMEPKEKKGRKREKGPSDKPVKVKVKVKKVPKQKALNRRAQSTFIYWTSDTHS